MPNPRRHYHGDQIDSVMVAAPSAQGQMGAVVFGMIVCSNLVETTGWSSVDVDDLIITLTHLTPLADYQDSWLFQESRPYMDARKVYGINLDLGLVWPAKKFPVGNFELDAQLTYCSLALTAI